MVETNIQEVHNMARAFLYTDIRETDIAALASHPFTSSWVVSIGKANGYKLIDLHAQAMLSLWRSHMAECIATAELVQLFYYFNKHYCLAFIKHIAKYLSNDDMARVLRANWTSIEVTNTDKNVRSSEIIRWFRRASKHILMDEDQRQMLESLDEKVTVYRGVNVKNRHNERALSWTLDPKSAAWFANRFKSLPGEVWKAVVPKESILCTFADDGMEKEVIVDLYNFGADIITIENSHLIS